MAGSWDESLETGNTMIDSQHRKLLSLLDELDDELESKDRVFNVLDELMELTVDHFLCEEALMDEVDYPSEAKETMIDSHKEFKSYVRLRFLEFREARSFDMLSFQSFTVNFLKTHEFGLDYQLVEWINQHHEKSRAA